MQLLPCGCARKGQAGIWCIFGVKDFMLWVVTDEHWTMSW